MTKIAFFIFLMLSANVFSQSTIEVRVFANNQRIEAGKEFTLDNKTYRLDLIKFYITNLYLLHKGTIVADYSAIPQLVNLEDDSSTVIHLDNSPAHFDEIRFTFGVDSLTNVSGIMQGALDPVNGMYWTWQSGYINCKLEGEQLGPEKKNIEYHLGGYLPHQLAARQVSLNVSNTDTNILEFHMDSILLTLGEQALFQIMSPGEKAVEASELFAQNIKIGNK